MKKLFDALSEHLSFFVDPILIDTVDGENPAPVDK